MDGQAFVPPDLLVNQVLPPMDLSVNECAVHVVIDVDYLFRFWMPCLFLKHAHKAVEALFHLPEDDVQSAHIYKHIVCITEHDIIRCSVVQTGVSCAGNAPVRLFVILH